MNAQQRAALLDDIASRGVPDDLDLWPQVRARLHQRRRASIAGRVALAASAALVAIVALSLLPSRFGAEAVSAESILDRAVASAGAATTVRTYHLVMTRQGPSENATSEVWFGGPDRQRTVERVTGSDGSVTRTQDVIFNGPETWIVTSGAGQMRAIHTIGTTWTRPADDPASGGTLADVLNRYTQKQCVSAHLDSEDSVVAGQATYLLQVQPRPEGCVALVSGSPQPGGGPTRVSGQVTSGRVEADRKPRARLWVDKQTFLPLKMELHDASGQLLERSEVTSVDYNVALPDGVFSYSPPSGVQVSTFQGGDGADVKRALSGGSDTKPSGGKP
jgi:outer membrane lipoprotein-sorting protein